MPLLSIGTTPLCRRGWRWLAFVAAWLVAAMMPTSGLAWSHGHRIISLAAFEAQPAELRALWSQAHQVPGDAKGPRPISEYLTLYEFWAASPDHFQGKVAQGVRDGFLYYEGNWLYHYFTLSPEENLARAERGATWYFEQIAKAFRENRPADAARYAGGFAHAIEDRGYPVHAWDGNDDEREAVEAKYTAFGLSDLDKNFGVGQPGPSQIWWADDRNIRVDLSGYEPTLLGATPEEAATETARRLEAMGQVTRQACSDDPSTPGTFLNEHLKDAWHGPGHEHPAGSATVAILNRMAEQSARLVADVYYSGYLLGTSTAQAASVLAK